MKHTYNAALMVTGECIATFAGCTVWFAYCELYIPLEVAGLEEHFEN